jgi:hypothetical protein
MKTKVIFLFDAVTIWEFSPVWTDFDKCHNLSKRNVKLILKKIVTVSNKKSTYAWLPEYKF